MRRDRTIAFLLLLAALGLFFYPLLLGQTFSTVAGHQGSIYPWRAYPTGFTDYPQSDQADLSYPWQAYLTRSIRAGEWPWWNPGSFGGQPLFSNGSSAMFYPPRLLAALLVSPSWAHDLLSALHLLFGGWFMYLLLRELDAEFPGALYGALTWMLNSFAFAWLHLEVVAPVLMFLPLTVFCVVRAARTHSWSWSAGAAVSLGALLCAGHLPFMGITFLVSGVYAVWLGIAAARHHLARRDVQTAALELLRPWVTIALAAGIAAIVLLDTGLLRLVYWVLPELSVFRPLGRLLFLLNFAVAVLAGLGFDAIWRWALNPRLPAWAPNNRMVVTASSSHAGWLVVPDTFDKGWTATVNGKAARLLRANYAFRAIPVPAGPLQVEMRYVPAGLVKGAVLTGLAIASCALLVLASWRIRRREARRGRGPAGGSAPSV